MSTDDRCSCSDTGHASRLAAAELIIDGSALTVTARLMRDSGLLSIAATLSRRLRRPRETGCCSPFEGSTDYTYLAIRRGVLVSFSWNRCYEKVRYFKDSQCNSIFNTRTLVKVSKVRCYIFLVKKICISSVKQIIGSTQAEAGTHKSSSLTPYSVFASN